MPRNFKVTIDVDFLYEMEYRTPQQMYDQRDGGYYTSYKTETKTFQSVEDARNWLSENEKAEPVSFVYIENCLTMLKAKK